MLKGKYIGLSSDVFSSFLPHPHLTYTGRTHLLVRHSCSSSMELLRPGLLGSELCPGVDNAAVLGAFVIWGMEGAAWWQLIMCSGNSNFR